MLYDHATKLRIQVHDHIYNRKLKSIPHFRLVPHGFTKTISDSESARLFIHALGHQNEITNTHQMKESIRQITFKAKRKASSCKLESVYGRDRSRTSFNSHRWIHTLLDSSESANIGIIPSRHATTTGDTLYLFPAIIIAIRVSSAVRSRGNKSCGLQKTPRVQTFELQTQKEGGENIITRDMVW